MRMQPRGRPQLAITLFTTALAMFVPSSTSIAHAQASYEVVYAFTGGVNGSGPMGPLLQASDGNFFGTTASGGDTGCGDFGFGCGIIFRLTAGGSMTVMHAFDGEDGRFPQGPLIQGSDGNFYGTTMFGGNAAECGPPRGCGTIFQMTPAGAVTVLYSFSGGTDGSEPQSGVVQGLDGNFYGTTDFGGDPGCGQFGCGTIFRVTPDATFTLLHVFTGGPDDGAAPWGGLIQTEDGTFYGTTIGGGSTGYGTIYQMTPDGTFTILHAFTGGRGAGPYATLLQAADGNLYGTTRGSGPEVVFAIAPDGTGYTVVHDLVQAGVGPFGTLLQASDGLLYGTVRWFGGGDFGCGEELCGGIFMLAPDGTNFSALHPFTSSTGGRPVAGLIEASDGNLYGTASSFGPGHNGVVFRLTRNP